MTEVPIPESSGSVNVATPHPDYSLMQASWEPLVGLEGGTPGMRACRTKWLPQEAAEDEDEYNARIGRTFLYPAYREARRRIVSMPFKEPVTVGVSREESEGEGRVEGEAAVEIDERLEMIEVDADFEGTELGEFAKGLYDDGVARGKTHILVDMPAAKRDPETGEPVRRRAGEEREEQIHPYFVHVKAEQLIGWRYKMRNGRRVLTQIRIKSTAVKDKGAYGSERVDRIQVWTEDDWETFERAKGEEKYVSVDSGKNELGKIPLVTIYFDKTGFMTARPPLEDLAWLNIRHWQSSSDQNNALHFIRMAFLVFSGITPDALKQAAPDGKIVIGGNRYVVLPPKDAKGQYIEPTGEGIKAGERHEDRLQDQFEILGVQPIMRGKGKTTATEHIQAEGRVVADAEAWVEMVEAGLLAAYTIAAEWISTTLPEGFRVRLFKDFAITVGASDEIELLFKMVTTGKLSLITFLKEVKRRGLLGDEVDAEKELERIKQDGPALGLFGAGAGFEEEGKSEGEEEGQGDAEGEGSEAA